MTRRQYLEEMARESVAQGLALLTDREVRHISVPMLDIASVRHCPLGQTRGWDTVTVPMYDRFRLGFTCGGLPALLDILNQEWKRQLLARKEVAQLIDGRVRK